MAVDAVISEEMRIGCDRAEVVDRNNLDVLAASLMQGAQDQPTDAPKAVDGYSYRMSLLLSTFMPTLRRSATSRLDLFCLSRHPGEKTGGTFAD
jgi:hypothetical protein